MSVKEFFKEWKPKAIKEMDKDDRTHLLYDYLPTISEFYIKKGHKSQSEVKELFERMADPKFAKTLTRILKTDEATPVEYGMATVIADFLERNRQNLDEELIETYVKAIDKILKRRIKKVNKKLELDANLIKELLVVVPTQDAISDVRFIGIYVSRVLRKLYTISKDNELGLEDVKTVKKLMKAIFGEENLNMVAVNVLLERKDFIRNFNENQLATWNLFTNFALDVLESNKKAELSELVEYYVSRRAKDASNQRDSARRIQFSQIAEEDYPRLTKVAGKLSGKDSYKQFL